MALVRDLINTPAEQMLPHHLADEVEAIAAKFGAQFSTVVGDHLLQEGFPAVHAVGRASDAAPRMITLEWGDPDRPRVELIGKGVCFDSGGLDIKPAASMRMMKKDMGGAANAIGLAQMIMQRELPVRLRLQVPAVENAISGNALRPGDVIATRKGISVEVHNTDAEGRIILSDALHEACTTKPHLVADFATLTGAARVAVGTELSAMFCNDDAVAEQVAAAGNRVSDPCWRLPLFAAYETLLDSNVADMANAASVGYAGSITAALFLQRFVPANTPWLHFDIMAWNTRSRPGRPEGGESMAMRAVYEHLESSLSAS